MNEELHEFGIVINIDMTESICREEFELSDCDKDTTIEQLFQKVLNWINAFILNQIPPGTDKYNIGEHNE